MQESGSWQAVAEPPASVRRGRESIPDANILTEIRQGNTAMTTLAGDDPTGIPMQALLLYFKAMLNPGRGVLLFALRTIAAGLLTLYLAFLFDLDQPKWSIMAVVIVSQPLAGMALARSFGQVIGTTLGAVDFRQRQMKLLGEISALEGVRRHLYFDAPRLRSANGLVQLLGNQLVLLTSRLMALRHQRELLLERWKGALPVDSQRLLAEELVFLDEVARQGRSLSTEARHPFTALQQRFDELAYRSERRNQVAANRGGRPGPDRVDERGNLRRHGEKRCLRHRRPGKPARRPIVGQHQSQLHLGQTGTAGTGADTDRCRLCR
jgi:hypothetical protein